MNADDLMFQKHALQKRRGELINEIVRCSDEIARIDGLLKKFC